MSICCEFIAYDSRWMPSGVERWTVKIEGKLMLHRIDEVQVFNKYENIPEKSLYEIKGVAFNYCESLLKIPKNLTSFFPNMIALSIYCCDLFKISRCDLKNLQSLREIFLVDTEIERLKGKKRLRKNHHN